MKKRYVIMWNSKNEIYYLNTNELFQEMLEKVSIEDQTCFIIADNIQEALEKYKSMTGNKIK